MKSEILEYLICPACLPDENPLRLRNFKNSCGEIGEGILECDCCRHKYAIKEGVAYMVGDYARTSEVNVRYESVDLLSAYLWSHYADLFEDPDATNAYTELAGQIKPSLGAILDAGCATGRFCFEMSNRFEFVIGVDLSGSFISTARKIMHERKLRFRLKEEGCIHTEKTFILPDHWDSGRVEFLVADVNALPFRSGAFSCVASLNILDKIDFPIRHISEVSRTANSEQAQLLMADPFSWSEAVCRPDRWLGGTPEGRFAGYGIENVVRLLSGDAPASRPAWKIGVIGDVWWKIRNHRNHFELIRSLYVKAER